MLSRLTQLSFHEAETYWAGIILQLARVIVSSIIILVVLVSLIGGVGLLAFQYAQISVIRTRIFTTASPQAYPTTLFTVILAPYLTLTQTSVGYYYQNGNFPGCDPASSACIYGIPSLYFAVSTITSSKLSTSFYAVTKTTQTTLTNSLIETNYQEAPMYAVIGLTDSQFIILVGSTALVFIAIVWCFIRRRNVSSREQLTYSTTCIKCGTKLAPNEKFCGECGPATQDFKEPNFKP